MRELRLLHFGMLTPEDSRRVDAIIADISKLPPAEVRRMASEFREEYERSRFAKAEEVMHYVNALRGSLSRLTPAASLPDELGPAHLKEIAWRSGWVDENYFAKVHQPEQDSSRHAPDTRADRARATASRRAFLDFVTANTVAQTPQRELGLKLYGMMNRAGMTTVPKEYEDYVLGRKRVDWSTIGRLEEHMPGPVVGPRTLRPSEQRIDFIQRGGLTHPERLDMREYQDLDFSTAGLGAAPVERVDGGTYASTGYMPNAMYRPGDILRAAQREQREGRNVSRDNFRYAQARQNYISNPFAGSNAMARYEVEQFEQNLRRRQDLAAQLEQDRAVSERRRGVEKLQPVVNAIRSRLFTNYTIDARTKPHLNTPAVIAAYTVVQQEHNRLLNQLDPLIKQPEQTREVDISVLNTQLNLVDTAQRALLAMQDEKFYAPYKARMEALLKNDARNRLMLAFLQEVGQKAPRMQRDGRGNRIIAAPLQRLIERQTKIRSEDVDKVLKDMPPAGLSESEATRDRIVSSGSDVFAKEPDITPPVRPPANIGDVDPPLPTAPAPDVQVQ